MIEDVSLARLAAARRHVPATHSDGGGRSRASLPLKHLLLAAGPSTRGAVAITLVRHHLGAARALIRGNGLARVSIGTRAERESKPDKKDCCHGYWLAIHKHSLLSDTFGQRILPFAILFD